MICERQKVTTPSPRGFTHSYHVHIMCIVSQHVLLFVESPGLCLKVKSAAEQAERGDTYSVTSALCPL